MHREILRRLLVAAVGAAAIAAPVSAQLPGIGAWRVNDTSSVVTVSIAASGGVSIGAYLAGAHWMLAELFKFMDDRPAERARFRLPRYRIQAISGASAGSINALLTALQVCDADAARPAESSAHWDFWTQAGLEQMLPQHDGGSRPEFGLLDRTLLDSVLTDRLRAELARPAREGCFIPVLNAVSRLVPATLDLGGGVSAGVQRYVASYSVSAEPDAASGAVRTVFRSPEPWVAGDTALGKQVVLLTTGPGNTSHELDAVYDLVKASSSVAWLFAPVQLWHCDAGAAVAAGGCQRDGGGGAKAEQARFLDGLPLDNAPLFGAMRLLETLPPRAGAAGGGEKVAGQATLFVNYDARRPPAVPPRSATAGAGAACDPGAPQEQCGGMGALQQFLGGLLASGGQYELQWLARLRAREFGTDAVDVDVTTRQAPIAGERLGNGAAFLARPLREFDFQIGIYDALHFVASAILCLDEHRRAGAPAGPDGCVVDTVRDLVDRLPLSCPTSLSVELLLRREHEADTTGAPRAEQLRSTAHCAQASLADRERAMAYWSTFDALTLVADGGAPPCPRAGLITTAICRDGTAQVLRMLGEDSYFSAYARREAERCRDAVGAARPALRARVQSQCVATRELLAAIDDPTRAFFARIRRLLDRAQWLEEEVQEQQRGPGGVMQWGVATQFANLSVRAALLAEETGMIIMPGTVPRRQNAWRLVTGVLLPQEIAVQALDNGWSYHWQPLSFRSPNGMALGASVGVLRNDFAVAGGDGGGRATRLTASLRAGYRPVQRGSPLLSGIMAGARYVRPAPGDHDASASRPQLSHLAPELRLEFLWDRLALTLTRNPGYGRADARRRTRVSFSVTDVGGVVYWLARSTTLR